MFEKFRRMEEATDRGKGAGLGLAISKGFVEAMGGRIAAASPIHDGKGTRIVISLPKTVTVPDMLPVVSWAKNAVEAQSTKSNVVVKQRRIDSSRADLRSELEMAVRFRVAVSIKSVY